MRKYLQEYLKEKPFFFSILRPKEASLYQRYKPFKRPILDLGCGDGFFAKVAFGKVNVGIDPDRRSIKEAKTRNIYKETRQYDGKRIPFPDEYFATILCNSTFEHIPNVDEVFHEVTRVLKKNGRLYFTVPTDTWPKYLFGRLLLGTLYENYFIQKSKHYNLYSFSQWKKSLEAFGFKIIYYTHYLDSKKLMWLFDAAHYLSIPSLLMKKVFNRWVLFPGKVALFAPFERFLLPLVDKNTKKGPYLFIAAEKRRSASKNRLRKSKGAIRTTTSITHPQSVT